MQGFKQPVVAATRHQRGCSTTNEHAFNGAATNQGQVVLQVFQQRVKISGFGDVAADRVGIEITVRALAYAPGHVNVEAQGRADRHGRSEERRVGKESSCRWW